MLTVGRIAARAGIAGALLLGALPSISSAQQAAPLSIEQLEGAAKAEGAVTYYSSQTAAANEALAKAFKEKYGIEVTIFSAPTAALKNRVQSEIDVGSLQADVVATGEHTIFDKNDGTFAAIGDLPEFGTYPELYRTEKYTVSSIQLQALVVNTNLVQNDAIKEWKDILKPEWKGKIAIISPKGSLAVANFYAVLEKSFGKSFLEDLAAQEPRFVSSATPMVQMVAAGEMSLGFPAVLSVLPALEKANAPIAVVPAEPSTGAQIYVAVNAKAEHPNAARLLTNFVMTREGQEKLNGNGLGSSPLPEIPGTKPVPAAYILPDESISQAHIEEMTGILGAP